MAALSSILAWRIPWTGVRWATIHEITKRWTQLIRWAAAKSPQSCLTLCDPIDCSPPGSPIPGILQARTLEWVAILVFPYRVNCSFYFKIGACRHGDRCSRLHNKPTFSQTIALLNIYRNPQNSSQSADGLRCAVSDVEMQEHYDEFFEEVFTEMEEKYGEVEEMNVCDNLGDHLVGNVYVKFRREEDAEKAVIDLNNRWFNGQPIHAELSPVTDFREACCRQYEMGECTRGGFCNFMHLKPISRELRRELYGRRRKKSLVGGGGEGALSCEPETVRHSHMTGPGA
uniref:U2 small nuclear RNA auxiliary factor 1 n=1 Tax=Bos taurus TaxID=9913 RepID=A0AAA9RUC6_BOVIN